MPIRVKRVFYVWWSTLPNQLWEFLATLIILKDRLMAHRQIGVSAVTFQEFVNTLSGKRTLSFKCAMHAKDKQVRKTSSIICFQ
jgi:hypothetical protein